ncbi:MAG: asparagine synthase (glutamine-hydrolyzing), partial [Myxococcales bacterium]|nr:asparagine synthase (glutamine-hydrolyzing) [Myxococcales bacterium]
MCGIAGIVHHRRSTRVDEGELVALRDAQTHRGPDDAGAWLDPSGRIGLGHRRLSIIDLSPAGHQPMATADGRFHVVFNGEIYNFRALRSELEQDGAVFRTGSDTEVLLHGYRAWGLGLLDRLRGMFAFALWDAETQELVLARDPLGIKPLYTCIDGDRLCFASEVQALRGIVDDGGLDVEALARYLVWGSIPAPRTLYRRIRALPAGAYLRVGRGGVDGPHAYYALEDAFGRARAMSDVEAGVRIRELLRDSVRAHLEADVPVGAFLSGGVDSSALVGLLAERDAQVRTVTLSFDVAALDEGELAREAARQYGTDHREVPIRADDVRDRMPDAIRALDQPSVDGVNTYFVSEAAVRAGLKVAVSGVGGDELFGGYGTFDRIPRIRRAHDRLDVVPRFALRAAARAAEWRVGGSVAGRVAKALRHGGDDAGAYFVERSIFSEQDVRRLLAPDLAHAAEGAVDELRATVDVARLDERERVSALELSQYLRSQLLRDTDAVSMRHSLEVRTPLVDRTLLESLCTVQPQQRRMGPAKRFLREAPVPPVPDALWNRPKQGFTLPFDHWLRSGGIELRLPRHEALRPDAMRALERSFRAGRLHFS